MKSKIVLLFAVIATLFGLYGVANQLSSDKEIVTQKKQIDKTMQVAMLGKSVRRGERISYEMLNIRTIKETEAVKLHLSNEHIFNGIEHGSVFKTDLSSEEYIKVSDLIAPNEEGYFEYIVSENTVPYFLTIEEESLGGGVVVPDSAVDVLAISGLNDIKSYAGSDKMANTVAIKPILSGVNVLQLIRDEDRENKVTLVLELTRKNVATLMVAKNIATLEVQKSTGKYDVSDLNADAGDIFKDFNSIREYRGNDVQIN